MCTQTVMSVRWWRQKVGMGVTAGFQNTPPGQGGFLEVLEWRQRKASGKLRRNKSQGKGDRGSTRGGARAEWQKGKVSSSWGHRGQPDETSRSTFQAQKKSGSRSAWCGRGNTSGTICLSLSMSVETRSPWVFPSKVMGRMDLCPSRLRFCASVLSGRVAICHMRPLNTGDVANRN